MHTRRIVTFLLGIWMGCSLLLGFLTLENFRSPNLVLSSPAAAEAKMIEKLGPEDSRLLLRHLAMEQSRSYLALWEDAQMVIGITLLLLLLMSSQTRMFPILMALAMLLVVLFQHFAVLPEMTFRGREADFPPGSASIEIQARVWTLGQIYVGLEALKLIVGGILASYLFVFYADPTRSKTRRRSSARRAIEVDG
jgi:hypothetical protein